MTIQPGGLISVHVADVATYSLDIWTGKYTHKYTDPKPWIRRYNAVMQTVWGHYKTAAGDGSFYFLMAIGVREGFIWIDSPQGEDYWKTFADRVANDRSFISSNVRQPYVTILEEWLGLDTQVLNYAQTIHRDEVRDVLHYHNTRQYVRAASALCAAFPWAKHPQGHDVWTYAHNRLLKNEPLPAQLLYSLTLMIKEVNEPHLFERALPKRIEIRSGSTILKETK